MTGKNRVRTGPMMAVQNQTNGVSEITIYGPITNNKNEEEGVSLEQLVSELETIQKQETPIKTLVVRINSEGGDVFAATAMYTRLKSFPATIDVKIDGWAASAATIVAMAGDIVEIAPNGAFMLHDPMVGLCGYYNENELDKIEKQMESIKKSIMKAYTAKTGKKEEEIAAIMKEETWYTAEEAVAEGFCDRIMEEESEINVAAKAGVYIINGIPMHLQKIPKKILHPPDEGKIEGEAGQTQDVQSNQEEGEKAMDEEKNKQKTTSEEGSQMKEIKNAEDLRAAYPEIVQEIEESAKNKERKRIKDIDEIAAPGTEEIINKAKYETGESAGDVAVKILNEQKKKGKKVLQEIDEDIQGSGMQDVSYQSSEAQKAKTKKEEDVFFDAVDNVFKKTK